MQDQDAHLLDMEPWRNWDLSESTVMEIHYTTMIMHGTMVSMTYINNVCFGTKVLISTYKTNYEITYNSVYIYRQVN